MLRHAVAGLAILFGIPCCSSMPPFDAPETPGGRPTVSDVVAKVRCEIAQARDDKANNNAKLNAWLASHDLEPFREWVASATLSLTISDTGGISPTNGLALSYINPLKPTGTSFMFGGNALLYQQRSRIYTQTYSISVENAACTDIKDPPDINLAGDLGLRDQIFMGLHAFYHDSTDTYDPTPKPPDSFGATASFDVYKGITNLGPTWTLVNFKGPGGGLGYQRDDLHKIAITFVPVAIPSKKAGITRAFALTAAKNSALVFARSQNNNLVQTQAVQQLGQIISNLP